MVFVTTPGIKQAEMVAASAQQHQQQAIHCAPLFYLLYTKLLFAIQNGSLWTSLRLHIGQRLKSAPQEDFFYFAMLRCVSCFSSCQEGLFNIE